MKCNIGTSPVSLKMKKSNGGLKVQPTFNPMLRTVNVDRVIRWVYCYYTTIETMPSELIWSCVTKM